MFTVKVTIQFFMNHIFNHYIHQLIQISSEKYKYLTVSFSKENGQKDISNFMVLNNVGSVSNGNRELFAYKTISLFKGMIICLILANLVLYEPKSRDGVQHINSKPTSILLISHSFLLLKKNLFIKSTIF